MKWETAFQVKICHPDSVPKLLVKNSNSILSNVDSFAEKSI